MPTQLSISLILKEVKLKKKEEEEVKLVVDIKPGYTELTICISAFMINYMLSGVQFPFDSVCLIILKLFTLIVKNQDKDPFFLVFPSQISLLILFLY